jgi:hypothetical protein
MKPLRAVILVAATLCLLAAAVFWSQRTGTACAATPAECLDQYYEAGRAGDVRRYLSFLAEPYRSQVRQRYADDDTLSAALRRDMKDVKSWVQIAGPVEEESSARVEVDEVRATGTRRLRFHLLQAGSGWLIVAVDPPRDMPTPIRYGTPVGEEP